MSTKIGRPKADNPKNIDVKVRFDKITHNEILEYCDDNKITKTELLRMGVNNLIELKKGLQDKHTAEYKNFLTTYLDNFNEESFIKMDKASQREQIKVLSNKLDELYGLLEKVRDEYLKEQGLEYGELFKKNIEVTMPINTNIISLQEKYYHLIMKLYECMGIN